MNENNYKKILTRLCVFCAFIILGCIFYYFLEPPHGGSDLDRLADAFPATIAVLLSLVIVLFLLMKAAITKELNQPTTSLYGTVLDKSRGQFGDILTIEFEDGSRRTLNAEANVILTTGESGLLTIRGDSIIAAKR